MTLPDIFIDQDSPAAMYATAGLDAKGIVAKTFEALGQFARRGREADPAFTNRRRRLSRHPRQRNNSAETLEPSLTSFCPLKQSSFCSVRAWIVRASPSAD